MARDWITIWQSELNAAATDRELVEGYMRLVDQWAQAAQAAASLLPGPAPSPSDCDDAAHRRAGAGAQAGPAAAADAPDARDLAIRELAGRVADLERILAELASRPEPGPAS